MRDKVRDVRGKAKVSALNTFNSKKISVKAFVYYKLCVNLHAINF